MQVDAFRKTRIRPLKLKKKKKIPKLKTNAASIWQRRGNHFPFVLQQRSSSEVASARMFVLCYASNNDKKTRKEDQDDCDVRDQIKKKKGQEKKRNLPVSPEHYLTGKQKRKLKLKSSLKLSRKTATK